MTHTILIVQGDELARVSSQMVLEAAGFRVVSAATSQEGFRKAKELLPDLVFFDVIRSDAGAWEVVARLKRDAATSNIPVIVISMGDEPEVGEGVRSVGVCDYFKLPFDPDQLIRMVEKHIGQKI